MYLRFFLILFITLLGAQASYAEGDKRTENDIQKAWQLSENKLIAGFFWDKTQAISSENLQQYKQDFLYQMNMALNNHLEGGAVSQTPSDICYVTDQQKAYYLEGKLVEFSEKKNAVLLKTAITAHDCQQNKIFQTDLMSQITRESHQNAKPDIAKDYVTNLIEKMKQKMVQ